MAGFPCRIYARSREKLLGSENCLLRMEGGSGLARGKLGCFVFSSKMLKDKACPLFLAPQISMEEVGGGC